MLFDDSNNSNNNKGESAPRHPIKPPSRANIEQKSLIITNISNIGISL